MMLTVSSGTPARNSLVAISTLATANASQTLDALDQGMRQCHLVTDGDEGFENRTNLLGYLQGREVSTATISRAAEYTAGRGVRIHWQARPSQSKEHRGHIPTNPNDFRFAPREETNRSFLPSHSSNPRLNGQAERDQRERDRQRFHLDSQIEADIAMVNRYYNLEIEKAVAEAERIPNAPG